MHVQVAANNRAVDRDITLPVEIDPAA